MKQQTPRLVILAILTALTVLSWVGFEVYRAFVDSAEPVVEEHVLAPLSPQLDASVLDELQRRRHLPESELADTVIIPVEDEEDVLDEQELDLIEDFDTFEEDEFTEEDPEIEETDSDGNI